ncbi:MAG: FG-GAP-like repeat-containing protein [Terracidiphilus sp.]
MKAKKDLQLLITASLSIAFFWGGSLRGFASSTGTALVITSGSNVVTTVPSGGAVTLTATVTAGATAVTTGQVSFCDGAATYCTDIHVFGTSQLTSSGTATLTFIPGIGSHSYKAVYAGVPNSTAAYAGSTSSTAALTVTGLYPAITTIAESGSAGNFTLTAQVGGAGPSAPSGTVSFLDTSNGDAALGTATLALANANLNFLNVSNPATGATPSSVAVGDFNGDGIPDLAMANYSSGTVTILLGQGNGMFLQAVNSPVPAGAEPSSVVVGDFNEDGIPDLAVANYGDGTVTILLGNGNGTFTQAANSPLTVGSGPSSIAAADFNGDGIPDLAVANVSGNTISILLGNGDGTFTQAANSPLTVGNGPLSVAVGDFNGNGIPDLAVANAIDSTVMILMGNGDGTFAQATNSPVPVGAEPSSIVVADFNGDGVPDLAVANYGSNTLTILLGNGGGTFTQAANSPVTVGSGSISVAAGDFNGDGVPDLAVVNYGQNTLTILLGQGNGTFAATTTNPATGGAPSFVAVGDFNGDGVPDLAVASEISNTVTVLETAAQTATATTIGITLPASTGVHQVVASYPSDTNYTASTSGTAELNAASANLGGGLPPGNSIISPIPPAGALANLGLATISVLNYGAVGDGRQVVDGNTVAGSATLTSATAAFTPADNGKTIEVFAGPANLMAATYTSGGSISGTAGQTCTLSSFNGGGTGETAIVTLTGNNSIASGTSLIISEPGSGLQSFTSSPTSATLGNGSATCSGTATIAATNLLYAPITTTLTYVNATTVNLGASALFGLTNATVNIGTDNTTALTNAFAGAANSVLFFPSGVYLSQPLTISSPVSVMGATQNSAILRADSGVLNQFLTVAANNVGFENITIDAKGMGFNNTWGNSGSTGNGIQFSNGLSNLVIQNSTIENAGGNGVLFIADSNVSVQNSTFKDSGFNQFLYQNTSGTSASNLQIVASTFDATASPCPTSYVALYAVDMATGSLNNVLIQGNTVLYPACLGHETDGIVLDGLSDTTITGVEIASNYVAGTQASQVNEGNAIELQYVDTTEVNGNTVLDGDVLSLYGNGPVAFSGNYIGCVYSCAWVQSGLLLYVSGDSSTGDVIQQGTIRGAGINITGANVTVTGDTVSTVAGGGTGVITSVGTTLSSNQIAAGYDGVLAEGAGVTLTGNTIVAGGSRSGITLYSPNTTIENNTISAPSQWAMRLLNGSGGVISGNTVKSSSIGVLFSTGVANATFSNNSFVSDNQGFNGDDSTVTNVFLSDNSFTSVNLPYAYLFAPNSYGFTVQTITPAVTVTPSASSITTTQKMTVTVAVSAGNAGQTPTGSVTVSSGSYSSSAATLRSGVATITIPADSLAVGADTLTATYAPDTASSPLYTSATATSSSVTVSQVTPTMTVNPSPLSITTTQSMTVTVAVSGGTGGPTPTGSVTVSSGSYSSSAATLSGGGATITIPAGSLAAGADGLTATYTPDTASSPIYTSATATSSSVTVSQVTPTMTVTPSASSITTTQSMTVTVAVSGGTGGPTPTGSVTVSSGSYTSSVATLSGGGTIVTIPAGSLAVSADTLTSTYTPDTASSAVYAGATATCSSVTVSKVTPTMTATSSASSISTTQSMTVTIAVSGGTGGPTPTGSVTVSSGSYSSPAATLSGGGATVTIPAGSLAVSADTLTATYTPDTTSSPIYTSATATSYSVTVSKATPAMTVTPSASSITTTQSMTVTVVVIGGTGAATPTGSVTISSGGYTSPAATLSGGGATITIPAGSLAVGTDTLTASDSGDANYNSAVGSASVTIIGAALLTSPTPGLSTVLGTSNVAFQWSAGTGATLYELTLGTIAPGATDLFVYKGTATSATAPSLPANGVTVYATLYSYINGVWQHNSYVYTEGGTATPAVLQSPTPGLSTVLGTSNAAFQWSAGTGVTVYQLNLSAVAPGDSELFLYKGAATSATVPTLPANGMTVYATLYSYINGAWQSNNYVYTESGTSGAVLTSPTPGQTTVLGTSNVPFQWTTGAGVAVYQLNLSAVAPGGSDLFLYKGTATSAIVPSLPANGVTVYATLYSKINGVWQSNAYVYTEAGTPTPAALTSPTPGQTTVLGTSSVLFQWTAGTGVTLYELNLSAIAPGESDLFLYKGTATSAIVPTLPANGVTVYATLSSYINGAWQHSSYVYTEGGTPTPAVLQSPTPGLSTVLGTSNVVFQWNTGIGVSTYQLNLSAIAPGDSDLYLYKGTATSTTAPTLPANGVEVYARLYSKINGVWQYNDYVYTEQ